MMKVLDSKREREKSVMRKVVERCLKYQVHLRSTPTSDEMLHTFQSGPSCSLLFDIKKAPATHSRVSKFS